MEFSLDQLIHLVQALLLAGAAYGAVKGELKLIRRDTERNQEAIQHAHMRLDDHIKTYHVRGGHHE